MVNGHKNVRNDGEVQNDSISSWKLNGETSGMRNMSASELRLFAGYESCSDEGDHEARLNWVQTNAYRTPNKRDS